MAVRRRTAWLIALGLGVTIAIAALLVSSWRQATLAAEWVRHTSDVRAAAYELQSHLFALQLEQRSYIITGARVHADGFQTQLDSANASMARIRALTIDSPAQVVELDDVERITGTMFVELRDTMHVRDTQGMQAAITRAEAMRTFDLSHELERELDDVVAEEDRHLAARERTSKRRDVDTLLELVIASVILGTIGTFAAQQRRTMHVVEDERRRFEAIFENSTEAMMLFDADLVVRDANHAALEILRLPLTEILEHKAPDLLPGWPQTGRSETASARSVLESPHRVIELTTTPHVLLGLHLVVFRDVTTRVHAEDARRVLIEASAIVAGSNDYVATFTELAKVITRGFADWCRIDVVDEHDELRTIARAHTNPKMLALSDEIDRRWPDDSKRVAREVVRHGQSRIIPRVDHAGIVSYNADPEYVALVEQLGLSSLIMVPIVGAGRPLGAMMLVSLESGRSYSEDDLAVAEDLARRAGTAIEQARAFARERETNRVKDEFLATVSHELRTPLTAILGWARLIPTLSAEESKKGIVTIERNATALARLVDDVLDVSRIITGKLQIAQQPIELAEVLRASIRVVEPMAAARAITIQSHIDECSFYGDAGRLQQVFWNLLSNAVKFTPAGGRVRCELHRVGASVKITVSDTGRGIAPEFLPHVFERFRQYDSSTTRSFGGLGLGLAIVRHLVELHGGSVRAESEGLGKGARFIVDLPVRAVAADLAPPAQLEEATPLPGAHEPSLPLDGLSVLVCDDEVDARELLCAVLTQAGAKVEAVGSANAAVEAVRHHAPSVLVSDIGMPQEDGYSLMRRVRALPASSGGRVPAVALTAYATKADVQRALAAGFQEHVAKPVDPETLVAKVADVTHVSP